MLDSVPAYVEAAIYCYFGLVAVLGCYLYHWLWRDARSTERVRAEGRA
ncbi:hypothetical protein [Halosolutus gelatinilyticus]|nr:hypothetical protein [Halosolutus gelatinilyticus]